MDDMEARALVGRVEGLLDDLDALADPAARTLVTELVEGLLDLYGEGLARISGRVDTAGLVDDELVSHLLLLHGLHPEPLETRVLGALEEVRPYLETHGGDVELVRVEEGTVRLRLRGTCNGCPSSAATLTHAIEDAIQRVAPDVEGIEAEGVAAPGAPAPLLQIECPAPLTGMAQA